MPFDALFLTCVLRELERETAGGRIDKIHQPTRDEVVLTLRAAGKNKRLLLSANPSRPRIHLTERRRENPEVPPMFCMLLRKYLTGARILSLSQPPMERAVLLALEGTDELGDKGRRTLVLEALTGRSNIILLDGQGRITDCIRRSDGGGTEPPRLSPGLFYRLPPAQDKADPTQHDRQGLARLLEGCDRREPAERLVGAFCGISPLVGREMAFRAGDSPDPDALAGQMESLLESVRQGSTEPYMLLRGARPADFSFLPILQYGPQAELRRYSTFSELLDEFYHTRDTLEHLRQRGQTLLKTVKNARNRVFRKLAGQTEELKAAENRDLLRRSGDIITANLHVMKKGMHTLRAVDFYHPDGAETEIALDPLLTPQQNAARYYKRYNKAKTAQRVLVEQIEKGTEELGYLDAVLEQIGYAEGEHDLEEIRQEIQRAGYLRAVRARTREKKAAGRPMEFQSTAGLRISVGKNNTQNDRLTSKLAGKDDIWLHTQKIHGAHVILWTQGGDPDADSLTQAAMLAAWFSQGRGGQKVAVDYTPARFVKKPAGARPGMVVYTRYETAYVTPDEALVSALRVK